ncbi:MAG: hypothetical protein ACW96U_02705 [Candidatus Heimdallarchaeaceae archaeon]|jgi:hypothetical protein
MAENVFEIVLTVFGILILISTIVTLTFVMNLLRKRAYGRRRWVIVQILLFFFVIGYTVNMLALTGRDYLLQLGVTAQTMVSLVYFFGGVFTIVTIVAIRNMLRDILGKDIPDDEALKTFLKITGVEAIPENILNTFTVKCEVCEEDVIYTIADVVRNHAFTLERGIQSEEVFGTRSFKIRPVHKCTDGRREITVVHDDKLEIRNVEENRLLYGGSL